MSPNNWLEECEHFISSEFNLQLNKSKLKQYSPQDWQKFCQANGFDIKSEGLYVPQSYSAYVNIDSPALISNRFHEYFGHGLFCEHSQIGKKLVDIIKDNKDAGGFLNDDINPQEQPLGLCSKNIANYEGFALWLEALLCEETGNSKVWQLKKDRLPHDYIELFEYFQQAEENITRFSFMSQLGFPKSYDSSKVVDTIKQLYGPSFSNIEFVVLYGSQKPESDIDLFVISNNPSTNYFNGWLDVYELNIQEFDKGQKNFDISVTDPIFSGTLIYGDRNNFEQLKKGIQEQPITQEAIHYNLAEEQKQKDFLQYLSETDKRRKDCLSYIDSFSQNAEQLSLGNRPLTLANLKQMYCK